MCESTPQFDDFICRNYQLLVRWCRGATSTTVTDPEELIHDAYLRCRGTWNAEQLTAGRDLAFLRQSIKWALLDRLRSDRRRRCRELQASLNHSCWNESELLAELISSEALAQLRGRQRQVCAAILSGQPMEEICRELELSAGAMYVCLSRARKTLLHHLTN